MQTISTQNYFRELMMIFFAQRRMIMGTILVVFFLSVCISVFWPPTYASVGSVLVKSRRLQKSPEAIEETQLRVFEVSREDLMSEMEIIKSHDVLEKALIYLAENKLIDDGILRSPEAIKEKVAALQTKISTVILPTSNIIQVTLTDKNPKRALTILDAIMEQYVAHRSSIFSPTGAEDFFNTQAENFKNGIRLKGQELLALAEKHQTADPTKEIENNLVLKKDSQQQRDLAHRAFIEKEQYLQYLNKLWHSRELHFFSSVENSSIGYLSQKLQDLYSEKGKLNRLYSQDSLLFKRIEEQTQDTYNSLKAEVALYIENQASQLKALKQQLIALDEKIAQISAENLELFSYVIEVRRINQEVTMLEESYLTFAKRREEARINSSLASNNLFAISLLSKPSYNETPIFPKKRVIIPLGLLVGFVTGCSLGFIREHFDHTFKTPNHTLQYAGLPTLFSIPLRDE